MYDAFIEGAKEGFQTAVRIIPYLVAILVGIGVFRASGAMDMMINGIKWCVEACGGNTDFVGALPTALMKPLSGSGARGMMVDAMTTYGADSFVGRLSCIFQGSTDTTFYILAVYFGSVGIRYTRHAVACGLLADLAGVIALRHVAGQGDALRVLRPDPFCKGDKQDQAQHIRYRKPEHPRDAASIGHLRGSEQ